MPGGLDALMSSRACRGSSTSQAGTPVTISAKVANGEQPLATTEAICTPSNGDGASAHARLRLPQVTADIAAPIVAPPVVAEPVVAIQVVQNLPYAAEPEAGDADAEDLAASRNHAEGIVISMPKGTSSLHRSGRGAVGDTASLMQHICDAVRNLRASMCHTISKASRARTSSLLDHGREVRWGREKTDGRDS